MNHLRQIYCCHSLCANIHDGSELNRPRGSRLSPGPFASPFCLCPQHRARHKHLSPHHSVSPRFHNQSNGQHPDPGCLQCPDISCQCRCVREELYHTYVGEQWMGSIWETTWLIVNLMNWKQRTLSPHPWMGGKIPSPKRTRPVEVYTCSNPLGMNTRLLAPFPF